ncbi:MAG: radical SAM family heme chaperone HemW [Christensenellales bacterium]|jgi:oxygen-independent coproporphyrinogen-3 oxidase
MKSLGVYIHIPFCTQKCGYCDFLSFPAGEADMDAYRDALCRELALWDKDVQGYAVDTVFIGGGTPTFFSASSIAQILKACRAHLHFCAHAEITIEANPGTIDQRKAFALQASGINRVSVGLQSAHDDILKALGRVHDYAQFVQGMAYLERAGIENINVDLMYGLPRQRENHFSDAVQKAHDAGARHISAYELILEEGTPFEMRHRQKELVLPDEDAVAQMEEAGQRLLGKLGYARYEVSNYAQKGYECRHNLKYWELNEYIGFGLGAHSCLKTSAGWVRHANERTLRAYQEKIAVGIKPVAQAQVISEQEQMFECFMLGLRKTAGVELRAFRTRFGVDAFDVYGDVFDKLQQEGLLLADEYTVRLTKTGMNIMNRILLQFM